MVGRLSFARACVRLCLPVLFCCSVGSARADEPDFGLMINHDGDLSFTSMDPAEVVRNLRAQVDVLAGTPVKTLMWCVGAGSDVLYYPTGVASVWCWQEVGESYRNHSVWGPRMAKIKAGMDAGIDPVRVVGERAAALGIGFVPSYRMNDDHFMFDPPNYPLTGEFWIRNHERLKIGDSPIPGHPEYGNLLDFSHAEVREFRFNVIKEIIDRYKDVMAGVELDFNRVQVLFPQGKGPERGHLVTDLVARVRSYLGRTGTAAGRRYHLFVRVPPTLQNCRWAGLEIAKWAEKRLVDVVIPAQLMTLSHDMPVDEFVRVCEPAGCQVYPALYPRTAYSWPFTDQPDEAHFAPVPDRTVLPAQLRGAVSNYWHMGAAGFQFFNTAVLYSGYAYDYLRSAGQPACLTFRDRTYAITPGYYLDHTDTYQYRKQIPAELLPGQQRELTLIVGEDLSRPLLASALKYCGLRLGFHKPDTNLQLEVKLNGRVLQSGPVAGKLVTAKGAMTRPSWGAHPPAPTAILQLPIDDRAVVKQGVNEIAFTVTSPAEAQKQLLTEVQLGVLFRAPIEFIRID